MIDTLASDAVIAASPDAIMSDVDGEIMLIMVSTGRYFGLDAVGGEVWRRIQQPVHIGELVEGLKAHFKGDEAVIEREALAFVNILSDRGLLTTH
jgi:hypothetical protein